jgi:hypothetical protein
LTVTIPVEFLKLVVALVPTTVRSRVRRWRGVFGRISFGERSREANFERCVDDGRGVGILVSPDDMEMKYESSEVSDDNEGKEEGGTKHRGAHTMLARAGKRDKEELEL